MTNAEKFEEVFGFYPNVDKCIESDTCDGCKYDKYDFPTCANLFWVSEYKEWKNAN